MAKPKPTKPKPAPRATVYAVEWTGYYDQHHFRIFSTHEKADAWMRRWRKDTDCAYVSDLTLDPESEHGD